MTADPGLRPCDLCGAPPEASRATWPKAPPGSASDTYVTCGRCGLVYANPLPGDQCELQH